MSRPKPNVLIEHTDKQTYKTEQVLASEGVWAVFYDAICLLSIQDLSIKK